MHESTSAKCCTPYLPRTVQGTQLKSSPAQELDQGWVTVYIDHRSVAPALWSSTHFPLNHQAQPDRSFVLLGKVIFILWTRPFRTRTPEIEVGSSLQTSCASPAFDPQETENILLDLSLSNSCLVAGSGAAIEQKQPTAIEVRKCPKPT